LGADDKLYKISIPHKKERKELIKKCLSLPIFKFKMPSSINDKNMIKAKKNFTRKHKKL